MGWFHKQTPVLAEQVKQNIESVAQLEQEFRRQRTPLDRISDTITAFAGSIRFVIAHVVLFSSWILLNIDWVLGNWAFDPYPFQFLNLVVALEAIFLSTFILMSQNRQNRQAEQWTHLGLQINLLGEQETTKMLEMLRAICGHLGLQKAAADKELKEMIATTHVEVLAKELEKAREPQEAGEANEKQDGTPPASDKRIPI